MEPETFPRVTIGIPAYNAAPWLDEAIESARAQDFPDWEMIIVDDGSRDATGAIADTWAQRDSRIRVLHTENGGESMARNVAIDACRTPFLAWFDADDISLPNRLSVQTAFLDAHPDIAGVGGELILWFPETGMRRRFRKIHGKDRIRDLLLRQQETTPLPTGALMVRTEALRAVGGCRPFFWSVMDLDLNIRLVEKGFALDNLSEPVILCRQEPHSLSRGDTMRVACSIVLTFESGWARREGRSDPIDSMTPPPRLELVESLAIPPSRRAWAYAELLIGAIRAAKRSTNRHDFPAGWLEHILQEIPHNELGPARIQIALGMAALSLARRGDWRSAFRAVLGAFRLSPAGFVRQGLRALERFPETAMEAYVARRASVR